MNKTIKKFIATISAVTMLGGTVGGLAACGKKTVTNSTVTFNTFTSVMPSNWNELTYQDNNDTQILGYIGSSLFSYDYKFDESKGGRYTSDGKVNADAIVDGAFTVQCMAATKLEDVTATVDSKWGYTAAEKATGGYAWKITLRDDLKWDDGTAIDASDFVYSMEEQLNPLFLNYRANTYYDRFAMKNASDYFFSNQPKYVSLADARYSSVAAAQAAGETLYLNVDKLGEDLEADWYSGAKRLISYDITKTKYDEAFQIHPTADPMPKWAPVNDVKYLSPIISYFVDDEGNIDISSLEAFGLNLEYFVYSTESIITACGGLEEFDVGTEGAEYLAVAADNVNKGMRFDKVGIYATDNNKAVVICLNKPIAALNSDGSLSYNAAYELSSLPLVKKDLYEKCKVAPAEGSSLWTTNYNTTLEKTASWGPYKLTAFQSGKSYTLEKNPYWFGWNMEEMNKDQYLIDKIYCEAIPEEATQWMAFLSGKVDEIGLDKTRYEDFKNSKYTTYTPAPGSYGLVMNTNLDTLKVNGRNGAAILAIKDFRKALSLAVNRTDCIENIWPGTMETCFGYLNGEYYYDVVVGKRYRDTDQAKKVLLRTYGFTESNGKWSDGIDLNNLSLNDAYDAITGVNLTLAKQLIESAYTELTTNAAKYNYDASKKITIEWGDSTETTLRRQRMTYFQGVIDKLTEGTSLANKIELVYNASYSSEWSKAIKNGQTDFFFGAGIGGNPFDPFDMITPFIDKTDELNYHQYWDTDQISLSITLPAGTYKDSGVSGQTITMTAYNWLLCLNGIATIRDTAESPIAYKYDFSNGCAPIEARLEILASLEECALDAYNTVRVASEKSGSLLGVKYSYIDPNYNIFVGYGGMRYMRVNYDDTQWAQYLADNNNNLEAEYKKTAD